MGLWSKYTKRGWIFTALLFSLIGWDSESVALESMGFVRQDYQKLIYSFEAAAKEGMADLLTKWPDFVYEATMFSNKDHLSAIKLLQEEYYREIAAYEKIVKSARTDRKKHSSAWLDEVILQFGRGFVKENRDTLVDNIQSLFQNRNELYFRRAGERLIYLEAELYGVYRGYFGRWIDFYKSLGKEEQNRLKSRKDAVDAFMTVLADHSIMSLLINDSPPHRLLTEIRSRRSNDALYRYLSDNIDLRYFDAMAAMKDLDKITVKSEKQ